MGLFGFGKNKNSDKIEEQNEEEYNPKSSFVGFVLLDELEWDREKFVEDFKNDWGIDISADIDNDEKYKDIILADVDDMRLSLSFFPAPVPNGEAEHYAAANYLWREAVNVTKTHKAQVIVMILGKEENNITKAKLYVKAVASCLKQKNAIAVYSDGAVYEPSFFLKFSDMLNHDLIPIYNLIWFGLYKDSEKIGFYTYGLKKFGKDEIEVYVDTQKADLVKLREFIDGVTDYVIENDITLKHGETIGFTAEQKCPITYSDGIALDGKTLKIEYM